MIIEKEVLNVAFIKFKLEIVGKFILVLPLAAAFALAGPPPKLSAAIKLNCN